MSRGRRAASVRLTREGWAAVIEDMQKRGAKVSEQEFPVILDYLDDALPRRGAAAAQPEHRGADRSRSGGRSATARSRGRDSLPRAAWPVQDARRSEERAGPRLQEDRQPARRPRRDVAQKVLVDRLDDADFQGSDDFPIRDLKLRGDGGLRRARDARRAAAVQLRGTQPQSTANSNAFIPSGRLTMRAVSRR